jgi:hypothetical protein
MRCTPRSSQCWRMSLGFCNWNRAWASSTSPGGAESACLFFIANGHVTRAPNPIPIYKRVWVHTRPQCNAQKAASHLHYIGVNIAPLILSCPRRKVAPALDVHLTLPQAGGEKVSYPWLASFGWALLHCPASVPRSLERYASALPTT